MTILMMLTYDWRYRGTCRRMLGDLNHDDDGDDFDGIRRNMQIPWRQALVCGGL